MVTFGNTEFSKLAYESVRDTVSSEIDFLTVVGKPIDTDTLHWITTTNSEDKGSKIRVHNVINHWENLGFPYSINDMFDWAWKNTYGPSTWEGDYDNFILMGNDIVVYPGCIDDLISIADETDYSLVSALQFDVKSLLDVSSKARKYFKGSDLIFTDFSAKPWEGYTTPINPPIIADMQMHDIQNLCLYKRAAFDTLGYIDTRFYPAYYADNDYVRRLVRSDLKYCTVISSRFFHFWSRTLYQGGGSASTPDNVNQYKKKWGGMFGSETLSPEIYIGIRG